MRRLKGKRKHQIQRLEATCPIWYVTSDMLLAMRNRCLRYKTQLKILPECNPFKPHYFFYFLFFFFVRFLHLVSHRAFRFLFSAAAWPSACGLFSSHCLWGTPLRLIAFCDILFLWISGLVPGCITYWKMTDFVLGTPGMLPKAGGSCCVFSHG